MAVAKIKWTDKIKNESLKRVEEEKNVRKCIRRRKFIINRKSVYTGNYINR